MTASGAPPGGTPRPDDTSPLETLGRRLYAIIDGATMARNLLARFGRAADMSVMPTAPREDRPEAALRTRPTSYIVIGDGDDGKAFVVAVRAFALAGHLGDHLTILGYGQSRRRLERWARTLALEDKVTFGDAAAPKCLSVENYDVAILVFQCQARTEAMLRILSTAHGGSDGSELPITSVSQGDQLGLMVAMQLVRSEFASRRIT